ncbi:hypothetical protein HAX54_031851 [Datura stramonium]|uniref:Uncharacterized protein n=1 Tax=Datura stramonium TaxID=4076 RepID=A0ABS8VCN6_DATST|nr:hypothetical protein [Datura stramonium]
MGNQTLIRETKVIPIIDGGLQRRKEEGARLLTELGWPERRKTKIRVCFTGGYGRHNLHERCGCCAFRWPVEKRRREVGGERKMMMRWPPEGDWLLSSLAGTMR